MTTAAPATGHRRGKVRRRLQKVLLSTFNGFLSVQQEHRRSQFGALHPAPGRVVFLGDSITELGIWEEWFPEVPVLNRGISGEVSGQVLARIDSAIHEPAAVFLLIGTNDLAYDVPPARIAENVRLIIEGIRTRAPGTPVVVQSVMPRALGYRAEVQDLNRRYQDLVERQCPDVTYLDLWPALATPAGTLRSEFTADKLHLNGAGYAAWVDLLRPSVTAARGAVGS